MLRSPGRHFRPRFGQEHVHLAPHPEAPGQVDARLDRKADSGNKIAFIGRLEIVEMWSRAMEIPVDRVAGAVDKEVAVSRRADDAACLIVECGPGDGLVFLPTFDQQTDRRIARSAHAHKLQSLKPKRRGQACYSDPPYANRNHDTA